jgi:N-acetyl-gamma-glutamyl-phosphate reductase
MKKIRIGIIGGAGYTGGELIRLLINHPQAEMVFVHSKSNAGNLVSAIHQDLIGETGIKFSAVLSDDIDVLFLCVGHGEAKKFLEANTIAEKIKIIDLSQDFRLAHSSQLKARSFVYGLPELNKEKIKSANNIANPGCFATALQVLPVRDRD